MITKPPKIVVIKAVKTALFVGTVLTLINQWQIVIAEAPLKLIPLALTYLVPFFVYLYSYFSNKMTHDN